MQTLSFCRSAPRAVLATSLGVGLWTAGCALAGGGALTSLPAQQVADSAFAPLLGPPAVPASRGPRVALDEAHYNFHTLDGRYLTFGRGLEGDGFASGPGIGGARRGLGDQLHWRGVPGPPARHLAPDAP